jgi:hypothetical protein
MGEGEVGKLTPSSGALAHVDSNGRPENSAGSLWPGVPARNLAGEPHCRIFSLAFYNEPARFVKTWSKGWLSRFFQCFKTSAFAAVSVAVLPVPGIEQNIPPRRTKSLRAHPQSPGRLAKTMRRFLLTLTFTPYSYS